MSSITRRQWITGAAALLTARQGSAAFAGAQTHGGRSEPDVASVPPKRYLSPVFTPEFLAANLLGPAAWKPYPKAGDAAWQAVPQDIRDEAIKRGEAILGTEWVPLPAGVFLEFKENGNRSHYEQLYFARRQRLTELVLAECMEDKGRFVREILNGAWFICEEPFWGLPAHLGAQKAGRGLPDVSEPIIDLFAAETGVTMAYVSYLVGEQLDQLSPLTTKRVLAETKRRILDPGLSRSDFFWMGLDGSDHRLNNWTSWIDSSWLETNLLLEPDPARRVAATVKICKSLDRYLEDYSDDGGCEEGPGYWGVSAASYFDCLAALTSATGNKVNVMNDPFFRRMGHFITDAHISGPYYVNYADAHSKNKHSPELLYRFGAASGDAVLQDFGAFNTEQQGRQSNGQGRLAREVPDILSVARARAATKKDALVREAWYPALGLMTARQKEGTRDGFYLAVQAARNNRNHGHCDSGSFIVFHDGEPVFIDVGVETYTAKTFSAERYTIWTMQSAYHNLPTVGGVMQSAANDKYRAGAVRFTNDESQTGLSMDLKTAYPEEAKIRRWQRDVRLDRKANSVRLTEAFQLQEKRPVSLSFMTPRVPTLEARGTLKLSLLAASAKDTYLKYDASLMAPNIEKIALGDELLRSDWGEALYRIRLTSLASVDRGEWTIETR